MMIYVVRQRYKESVKPEDYRKVNRLLDEGVIPAMEKVDGGGEIVLLVEIDEFAAIDRALVDEQYGRSGSEMFDYMVRVGGEVWYDRQSWEGCYGQEK
jgi:hypothetical protein